MTHYEMTKYNIWLKSESYRCHLQDKQEASLLNSKAKFPGYFRLSLYRPINQFSQNNVSVYLTRCLAELGKMTGYYNKEPSHKCQQKFNSYKSKSTSL